MLDGKEYGYGAEYAQNFADLWTVHLMTRSGSGEHYQSQMNTWLYEQFKGDDSQAPDWSKTVTRLISVTSDNPKDSTKPYRTNYSHGRAANYLLHNLGEEFTQERNENGKWDMVPATSRTTRLFLGMRTQCVQCHDHPFNGEWDQHHFWGINAFFRQIDTAELKAQAADDGRQEERRKARWGPKSSA